MSENTKTAPEQSTEAGGRTEPIVSRWCFHCLHWPRALTGHPSRVEMCRVGHGQTNGFAGCAEWQHASIFAANAKPSQRLPAPTSQTKPQAPDAGRRRAEEIVMQWQDIESAPRDGTAILGFADGTMTTVEYFVERGYWSLCECGAYAADCEWNPTHWMPLPDPPFSA